MQIMGLLESNAIAYVDAKKGLLSKLRAITIAIHKYCPLSHCKENAMVIVTGIDCPGQHPD